MDQRAIHLTTLTSGWRTGDDEQAQVLRILEQVPQEQLDTVLAGLDPEQLLGALSDRGAGKAYLSGVLDLLLVRRREALSVPVLAGLVAALHRGRTPRHHQELVVDVLRATEGRDFHDLKYRINASRDRHDLEQLVFHDLDEDLQDLLLEHLAEQAGVDPTSDLRILCDIDDTTRCMLHDDRYPRGIIYPGVVQLLLELDQGAVTDPARVGDLTFVTARPGGPLGLFERYTRDGLSGLGLPPHTVLGGSLLNLHTKAAITRRKLENMERDRLLFPECRMVFIGDSGQADGEVGAQMRTRAPEHIVGTLLHDVSGLGQAEREAWAHRGVQVFDTYAGAAAHATRWGLITVEQARRVADAVRTGLAVLELSTEQRRLLEDRLAADDEAIEALAEEPGSGG